MIKIKTFNNEKALVSAFSNYSQYCIHHSIEVGIYELYLSNTHAHHACNIATLQCQCTGHHGPSDVKVTSWEAICKFLFPPSWIIASWASELRTSAKSWSTWCSCCGRQPRQTLAPVFIGLFIFIPSAAPLHLQRLSGQWTSSKWVCDRWQPYSYGSRVTWMR